MSMNNSLVKLLEESARWIASIECEYGSQRAAMQKSMLRRIKYAVKKGKERAQIEAIQEEELKQYVIDNSQFGLGA